MDGLKARLSFDAVAYDYDDEYLTIDTDTHTININNVSRLFGVQYDGNSKLIKFRIRNKLSDIQKMQDSIVYINWIDSRGVKGQSIAINKTINNDTCEFAWKVPFDALKNSGVLHFAMSAVVTKNSSSVIDQRWSTQIASVITPDGIYIKSYTPSSEEEDRIAQIYNELSNMINKQNDNLQSQVSSLKEDLVILEDTALHYKNGKNLFPYSRKFDGIYIDSNNGKEVSYDGWSASDFIEIEANTDYQIFYISEDNNKYAIGCYYAYYNSDKVYISGGISDSNSGYNIKTPINAKYIRISFPNTEDQKKFVFGKKSDFENIEYDTFEYPKQVFNINDVINIYGTGFILPFSASDGKFKVEVDTTFVIYYILRDGKQSVISIPKGTVYLVSPHNSLVIDSDINAVVEKPRNRVVPSDVLLLETGEYDNNYKRYFKGFFVDRVTVQTSYEEYDMNNVRKSYVRTVDDKMVDVIKDNQSDFSFMIGTDMHIATSSVDGSRQVLNVINRIQDRVHCNAIINLGDSVMTGKLSTQEAYYSLQEVVGKTTEKENAYYVVGNHDYNHRSDFAAVGQEKSWVLPYIDVYRILGKQHENDVVWGSKERMYYYKDFVEHKIRMIFLNTLDRPEVWENVDGVQKEKYTWLMNVISTKQVDWLVDVALDFSDKADKSEWSVIICSHVTPSATAEWNDAPLYNAVVLRKISEAFVSGGTKTPSFTDTTFEGWSSYNKRVDFTSQGAMNLIGWFSGHSHIDTHSKLNGVNYVNTVCGYPYNVQDSQSMKNYTMTDGTYTEFGIDVCSLNKAERKVTLHRFGVGTDRVITY